MVTLVKQAGFDTEPPPNLTVVRYEWATNHNWHGIKAEVAADVLTTIVERDGTITPTAVVDESRPADAPLHKVFEWNDKIAAAAYREEQARQIIKRITVVYQRDDTDEELPPVRAFVRMLPPDDESEFAELSAHQQEATQPKRYVPVARAMEEPLARERLFAEARRELESFRKRYSRFQEFGAFFEAFDAAIGPLLAQLDAADD